MSLFNKLNWTALIISLSVGIFFCYLLTPTPNIVIKFPTPDNVDSTVYVDETNNCYKYRADEIEKLIQDINSMNYGLTLGIQSRIENTINYIFNNANIGNIYINRNIVGAVVGVQPFGGRGLSGTGPKAGGPNYLLKFVNEKSYSYDTTAAGGNATLFMMSENE